MSTPEQSQRAGAVRAAGAPPPARRVIATYDRYADAERAVDFLSDNDFPVERVAIVGRDLKTVEQVTGRLTLGRAALNGAAIGALTGALIGWLFWLFNWFDPVVASGWLIVDGFWFGGLAGALLGVLAHALSGGRRDFSSVPMMTADRYEVLVDEDVADRAATLLARPGEARSAAGSGT